MIHATLGASSYSLGGEKVLKRAIIYSSICINILLIAALTTGGRVVPLDLAVTFSKVSYIQSCIVNNKKHNPDKSWKTDCKKLGDQFVSDVSTILK